MITTSIGPFCYIDRNTVIGDNNVFQNSVTIHFGARIGNNNEIFPGEVSLLATGLEVQGRRDTLRSGVTTTLFVRMLQFRVVQLQRVQQRLVVITY